MTCHGDLGVSAFTLVMRISGQCEDANRKDLKRKDQKRAWQRDSADMQL